MRTRLFFSVLIIAFTNLCGQNTWLPLISGTTKNLSDLSFPSPTIGYVVGEKGTILKTANSGTTWLGTFSDTTRDFLSVSFPGINTGYVVSNTRVYRTQNAGVNWQMILSDTVSDFKVIYFINDSVGFIGTASGILKTTNYGNNWNLVKNTTNQINTIDFPSPSIGYFTGGPSFADQLYKTNNQGQSFTTYSLGLQVIKERVWFMNDSVGYMAGWYGGCLDKTTNGGQTWIPININNDTQAWDVFFYTQMKGFYINNGGGTSKIYSSTDGGINWIADISATPYTFRKFTFTQASQGFAVGKNGGIYSTQLITSIKKTGNSSIFTVYPNPNNGAFTISSGSDLNFILTNELGQEIRSINLSGANNYRVQLDDLKNGIYFLRLTNGKEMFNQKIIVINN